MQNKVQGGLSCFCSLNVAKSQPPCAAAPRAFLPWAFLPVRPWACHCQPSTRRIHCINGSPTTKTHPAPLNQEFLEDRDGSPHSKSWLMNGLNPSPKKPFSRLVWERKQNAAVENPLLATIRNRCVFHTSLHLHCCGLALDHQGCPPKTQHHFNSVALEDGWLGHTNPLYHLVLQLTF